VDTNEESTTGFTTTGESSTLFESLDSNLTDFLISIAKGITAANIVIETTMAAHASTITPLNPVIEATHAATKTYN
jgi:hypothetical protein